ncbi:hypothetical protein M434DRAFT_36339 [Hypoxylon sp. CO27-5]|nr:hypothetical protein M434DRAFT_36339 [Hypoxylon sp. CO27-5]
MFYVPLRGKRASNRALLLLGLVEWLPFVFVILRYPRIRLRVLATLLKQNGILVGTSGGSTSDINLENHITARVFWNYPSFLPYLRQRGVAFPWVYRAFGVKINDMDDTVGFHVGIILVFPGSALAVAVTPQAPKRIRGFGVHVSSPTHTRGKNLMESSAAPAAGLTGAMAFGLTL